MYISSYTRKAIRGNWNNKEELVVICARELGEQLWDRDSMYGTRRDRDDHEAKVARLGLALGVSTSQAEFIRTIAKIETVEDRRRAESAKFTRLNRKRKSHKS